MLVITCEIALDVLGWHLGWTLALGCTVVVDQGFALRTSFGCIIFLLTQ